MSFPKKIPVSYAEKICGHGILPISLVPSIGFDRRSYLAAMCYTLDV